MFPIFHASSLKINTLKIDAIKELALVNASLIDRKSKDVCVQAILMPHLSKKLRLRAFAEDCLKSKSISILSLNLDPYPFYQNRLQEIINETPEQDIIFKGKYIIGVLTGGLRRF